MSRRKYSGLSGIDNRKRRKVVSCPICRHEFRDRETISGHMNQHNPRAARMDWDCTKCGAPQASYGHKMSEARKKIPADLLCEKCRESAGAPDIAS